MYFEDRLSTSIHKDGLQKWSAKGVYTCQQTVIEWIVLIIFHVGAFLCSLG